MSGIEVAGIALAAFPILINGLNHVIAGIETIRRWKRYRLQLKDYADVLESASVFFLDTLDELLVDVVQSDEELSLLLGSPGGLLWKKNEYEERLRKRLDRSYVPYLKTVEKLVRTLRSMCDRLGVDDAGSVRWDDYSVLDREMKRIRLTFSKTVYKEMLNDIRMANQDLREVTHQNIALEPKKQKRKAGKALTRIKTTRKHAASVYRVLMKDSTWQCKCGMRHLASLRLETRSETGLNVMEGNDTSAFRILLSVATDDRGMADPARLQDIEILPFLNHDPSNKEEAAQNSQLRYVENYPDRTRLDRASLPLAD
ncbi:MAG: hypothetical protein Q9174_004596 [Haloplaca sp. 1 TL-2023]